MLKQIARLVADAKGKRTTIGTNYHATNLFAAYPGANFSIGQIVEELIYAAKQVGVPVDKGRPD